MQQACRLLHEDESASRFSVGIPLGGGSDELIVLLPDGPRGVNVLENAAYCPRVMGSAVRSIEGWDLEAADFPEVTSDTKPTLIELAAKPGDVLILRDLRSTTVGSTLPDPLFFL